MNIIVSSIVLILGLVALNCAVPLNELPANENAILPESQALDNESEGNAKRPIRQVAVNVGPVGVGVGPFGGVGVRIGNLFNLGVAPSYPIAYPPPVPVVYQAPVPVVYQPYRAAIPVAQSAKYSYSSNYRYNYYN